MDYQLLILDEDPIARRRWVDALIQAPPMLGIAYQVTATGSAAAARLQATRRTYQLLLVVVRRGTEMIGLAVQLRELYPHLRIILIGEQGHSSALLKVAEHLDAELLTGSVSGALLNQAVREALGVVVPAQRTVITPVAPVSREQPSITLAEVMLLLDDLRRNAHAQLAIYADHFGHLIAERGDSRSLDLPALTSLIASGFINSMEMGRILQDPNTAHLSVHEGAFYDIYSAGVGNDRLLALVFDKQISSPKLGMVWLQLKRHAEQLCLMRLENSSTIDPTINASLNDEFDRLFGAELLPQAAD